MLEVAFYGSYCELMFGIKMNAEPFPHVCIQVDDGARVETLTSDLQGECIDRWLIVKM